jgi:hypothetical protein
MDGLPGRSRRQPHRGCKNFAQPCEAAACGLVSSRTKTCCRSVGVMLEVAKLMFYCRCDEDGIGDARTRLLLGVDEGEPPLLFGAGGWVPDKGRRPFSVNAQDHAQQVPCRGFAAPSDQSPRHKSAKAWPGRKTAVKGADLRRKHVGRVCRVLVQAEENMLRCLRWNDGSYISQMVSRRRVAEIYRGGRSLVQRDKTARQCRGRGSRRGCCRVTGRKRRGVGGGSQCPVVLAASAPATLRI